MYNWDAIAYVALAGQQSGSSAQQTHDRAYNELRHVVSPVEWAQLTSSSEYRLRQYMSAETFQAELGMYSVKAGYVQIARLFSLFMAPFAGLRLINLLSLCLIGGAGVWWMRVGGFGQSSFFLVPAMLSLHLILTARLLTPDMLCAGLSLAGIAALRRGPWFLAACCFAAASYVRPDAALFPGVFLIFALAARHSIKVALIMFLGSSLAVGMALAGSHHPGLWTQVSTAGFGPYPDLSQAPPFSISSYAKVLGRTINDAIMFAAWPYLAALAAAGWLLARRRPGHRELQADILFAALVATLIGRTFVFLFVDDRIYLPLMIMLLMLLAERWSPRFDIRSDLTEHRNIEQQ